MRELLSLHWEKLLLALALSFGGFCWWHGGQAEALVGNAEKKFKDAKEDLARIANGDPDGTDSGITQPGVDKKIILLFSELHTSTYTIPASPSSGFENLGELVIQEGKGAVYTPPFTDLDIKKAFSKLHNPDISISVTPPGILDWKIGTDGSSIEVKALKFGEAILTLKDKTLKGAHVKIRVKQSLKIKAFVPEGSLKALPDPIDLNLVTLTWDPALVSHVDLASVGTYTLFRQLLEKGLGSETAPWETLQSWDGPVNPGTFKDSQAVPGKRYRYKLTVTFRVSKEFEEKDYTAIPLPEEAIPLSEDETKDYLPTPVIVIPPGVQLMGFVGVQDPGDQGDPDKNKVAKVAVKVWHRFPEGGSKWIANSFNIDRLLKGYIQKPERGAKEKLIPISRKNQLMGPNAGKLYLDVITPWLLYNVQVHKAGDNIQGTTFIDKDELKRISTDGKKYKSDTRSFWIIDVNDPYFSDPTVNYPKSRRVLHEHKDLHNEVNAVNRGNDKPDVKPPAPPSVTGDAPVPKTPEPPSETPPSPSITADSSLPSETAPKRQR